MLCYVGGALYFISTKSAEQGIVEYLESKLCKKYNKYFCEEILKEVSKSITIPKEYDKNDSLFVLSGTSKVNLLNIKRFTIGESGLTIDTSDVTFPLPKFSSTKYSNYTNFAQDLISDSKEILSAISEQKVDCNNSYFNIGDTKMFFSADKLSRMLEIGILDRYFNNEYCQYISNDILHLMTSSSSDTVFLRCVVNKKSMIYAISECGINEVNLSATILKNVTSSYFDIKGMDKQIQMISNRMYNNLFYDENYWDEELSNPYDYDYQKGRFLFKKKVGDIEFYFCWVYGKPMWVSNTINVPIKDLKWKKSKKILYCPTYKGYSLEEHSYVLKNDICLRDDTYATVIAENTKELYLYGEFAVEPDDMANLRLILK